MASKKENNDDSRLIFIEPNPEGTGIPAHEDLSILVELKTITRGRSVITANATKGTGDVDNSDESGRNPIGFLEGSGVGGGRRSLTTNYTEINTNFSVDGENDLESLGIESIDISFDTSYTPIIKIKFIDVRGQAVLQQGNQSKYKMFFELPYPIFELTVKGFYGKAVTYCLHLTNWNASFNSNTGNFEINADFIGYTYALLTDCLLGLMRATVMTSTGSRIFRGYQNQTIKDDLGIDTKIKKYPGLKTIDEFLDYVNKIGNVFEKVKTDNDIIKQINALTTLGDKIKKLNQSIIDVKAGISSSLTSDKDLLKNRLSNLVLIAEPENAAIAGAPVSGGGGALLVPDEDAQNIVAKYKADTRLTVDGNKNEGVSGINDTIELPDLEIKTDQLVRIIETVIKMSDIGNTDLLTESILKESPGDNGYGTDEVLVDEISHKIDRAFSVPEKTNDAKLRLFDLEPCFKETKRVFDEIKKRKKELRERLISVLKQKVASQDFKPTIKNIIDMLAIHSQVFLQTIQEVSEAAEGSTERVRVLKESLTYAAIGGKEGKPIYPWPEYKTTKSSSSLDGCIVPDESLYESWMGADLSQSEIQQVPEVKFVEELLGNLMKIAKEDEKRIDSSLERAPDFFPMSAIDVAVPIGLLDGDGNDVSLIKENPYFNAIIRDTGFSAKTPDEDVRIIGEAQKTTPDEAFRCLLLRGFNGLGLANRTIGAEQQKIMGKLEAENLFAIIKSDLTKVQRPTFINQITTLANNSSAAATNTLISNWTNGVDGPVNNPPNNKGGVLLSATTIDGEEYYEYTYLRDEKTGKSYIPISGGFDCKRFVDDTGKMKSAGELKDLSSKLLFVGNGINHTLNNSNISDEDDGAIYLKIVDSGMYTNQVFAPGFGGKPFNEYIGTVGETSLIEQSRAEIAIYDDADLVYNDKLNRYNGIYKNFEINNIIYDGDDDRGQNIHYPNKNISDRYSNEAAGDVMSAYYYQDDDKDYRLQGTYLAKNTNNKIKKYTIDHDNQGDTFEVFETPENEEREDLLPDNYGAQRELLGNTMDRDNTDTYLPYIEFNVSREDGYDDNDDHYSLFGSPFYYSQTDIGKAFLFLHSISWEGSVRNIAHITKVGTNRHKYAASLFDTIISSFAAAKNRENFKDDDDTPTLKALFGNSGSFIKAPELWCAFIGGLLYRLDNVDIINWSGTTANKWLLPYQDEKSYTPKVSEYLYSGLNSSTCGISLLMNADDEPAGFVREDYNGKASFSVDGSGAYYPSVDKILQNLPLQARNEFKNMFLEFVGDPNSSGKLINDTSEFAQIKKQYELFNDVPDIIRKWTALRSVVVDDPIIFEGRFVTIPGPSIAGGGATYIPGSTTERKTLTTKNLYDVITSGSTKPDIIKGSIRNYQNISPIKVNDSTSSWNVTKYQFDLTLRPITGSINKNLVKLFGKHKMIMNARPAIFTHSKMITGSDKGDSVNIPQYEPILVKKKSMDIYLDWFFSRFKELAKEFTDPDKGEEDRLQKKIFNSIDDDTVKLTVYRTLASINAKWISSTGDKQLKKGKHHCADFKQIADSFKFLDSSFSNIGSTFLINPQTVYNKIIGDYNQSFFNIANKILSENHFNFIPLPSFINFKNEEELKNVFTAYPYKKAVDEAIVGPSFVCVYVGQKSTNLNLGTDSEHEDDGVYIRTNETGDKIGVPEIFKGKGNEGSPYIPYFLVSYAKGNQSIFKDIKLDQKEFTETAESLQIIEGISNSGDKRKPTFNGQNLFNVYQKRSYSAEVEMMGNAMIQPMMYFQLNNIPMFRGAYLILNASHSITPHNMTTKFKGVRVKNTKTQLIDEGQLFMNLLGSLEEVGESDSITALNGDSTTTTADVNTTTTAAAAASNSGADTVFNPFPVVPPNPYIGANGPIQPVQPAAKAAEPTTTEKTSANFIDTPLNVNILPVNKDTNPSKSADVSVKPVGLVMQPSKIEPYAIREVIETLQTVAKEFYEENNRNIYYNDLSNLGGGKIGKHHSHKTGLDIDFRAIANVTYAVKIPTPKSSFYDRDLTRKLINKLNDVVYLDSSGAKTSQKALDQIFFNDSVLIEEYKTILTSSGKKVVSYSAEHDNHLHVRFLRPTRVEADIVKNESGDPKNNQNSRKYYA